MVSPQGGRVPPTGAGERTKYEDKSAKSADESIVVCFTIWSGKGAKKLYQCHGVRPCPGLPSESCGRLMTEDQWRRHKLALLSGSSCADALTDKRRTQDPPIALPPHAAAPPPFHPFPPQAADPIPLGEDHAMDLEGQDDEVREAPQVHGLVLPPPRVTDAGDVLMASPPDGQALIFNPYWEDEAQVEDGQQLLEGEEGAPALLQHEPEEEGVPLSLKGMLLRALAGQLLVGDDEGRLAEMNQLLQECIFDQLDEEGLGEALYDILGEEEEEEAIGEGSSSYDSSSLQEPVCVGSRATKLQYVYKMLQIFVEGGITVTAFNALIGFLSTSVFPSGSRAPNNLNQLKKLILVDQATKFEFSICIHGCHLFSTPCGSSGYASNQERCGCSDPQPRFIRKGKSWKPNGQRFWDFGILSLIQELFSNPVFAKHQGQGRGCGWFQGAYAKAIDQRCSGQLLSDPKKSCVFGLGCDGGQPFLRKVHSTFIVVFRSIDLPETLKSKSEFIHTLLVFEGPSRGPTLTCSCAGSSRTHSCLLSEAWPRRYRQGSWTRPGSFSSGTR